MPKKVKGKTKGKGKGKKKKPSSKKKEFKLYWLLFTILLKVFALPLQDTRIWR